MPCLHFSFSGEIRKIKFTVRRTVDCRRLDGGNTSICALRHRCKRISPLGPKMQEWLFYHIRHHAKSFFVAVHFWGAMSFS